MKYKDFKVMSQNEMKNVKGGNAPEEDSTILCTTDADCDTSAGWRCRVRAADQVKRCARGSVVFS